MVDLGMRGVDIITGFSGIVVGKCEYLSGCTQLLLVPKVGADGKKPDGEWFDIQRISSDGSDVVTLDNAGNPGCDISAPKY
jgi:hypothetical protein